jgi:two-component sensor histidine kinase
LINSRDVLLPINAAIPCGLLVNELISNALKHAFPDDRQGEITIELLMEGAQHAVLTVSDNGVGISETFSLEQTQTLGLQLVTMLSDQLGGVIEIHRANPTRFALRFPIEKEEVDA